MSHRRTIDEPEKKEEKRVWKIRYNATSISKDERMRWLVALVEEPEEPEGPWG
jgi:hypothetical protein